MQIHREFAEQLVAKMKSLHTKPLTRAPAREAEFTHLDLGSYRHYQTALETLGYRFLDDIEILEVNNSPGSVMARTMIRSMISADGLISAGHYQVRPRIERLASNLVRGILNLRLLDAPASFLGNLQTRQIYDFESEIGSTYLITSNAEIAGKFSAPASIDASHLPSGTPVEAVRRAHVERLASTMTRTGGVPTHMATREDIVAMADRMRQQKAAHRAASGWITRDELLRFTNGNVALTDSVFDEVQAIIHQS